MIYPAWCHSLFCGPFLLIWCHLSFSRRAEDMPLGNDIPNSHVGCSIPLKVQTRAPPITHTRTHTHKCSVMSSESDGAPSCRQKKKVSVPSQANNNKPRAGFQWAFSLKWDTATRITNISLVLSSRPGPWKNYSKYLSRFIWNLGIG